MKTTKIKVEKRTELGKKGTQGLRKKEHVPCVLYGGEENVHFHAHINEFRKIVYTSDTYLVEFEIDGKAHHAVIKDIQFHPVNDSILHIDFVEVIKGKPSIVSLPIKMVGSSVGVIAGGKLRLNKRYLKVKGDVDKMPEILEVNIGPLKIGDSLKVRDLSFENIELLDPEQSLVVAIATSRVATTSAEEVAETEGEGEAAEESAES